MRVLSEAPCRISLFGGSTDIPPFSTTYGGVCLNFAINIRQRIILNDENKWDLRSYDDPGFFHLILDNMLPGNNFGVQHEFNGATGAGISSSASLAVALVGAVNHYDGMGMTRHQIAERARDLEVNKVGLLAGFQDQYCASYGGVNIMMFGKTNEVHPLPRYSLNNLFEYLQLFYLGSSRVASQILHGYEDLTPEKIFAMTKIKLLALNAFDLLPDGSIFDVAELLKEAWEMKKNSNNSVSSKKIDDIYNLGLTNGALAGKVLGAGGGGHMLFLVPPDKQKNFKSLMESINLKWVDFAIDWQGLDCRFI